MSSEQRSPWWEIKKDKAHEAVCSVFRALDDEQEERKDSELHHARLYSNRLYAGLVGEDWRSFDMGDKLRMNVAMAVVDTAVAHIATNKIRTMFLTKKGSRKMRLQGQALGRYVTGLRRRVRQHITGLDVFRDALIFGSGFEKVAPDFYGSGEVIAERVLGHDLVIDDREGRDSDPRAIYRIRDVDPYVLAMAHPSKREEIFGSGQIRESTGEVVHDTHRLGNGPVSVIEATRLPDGKGKHGRRVVCTTETTLSDHDYDLPYLPYLKYDWKRSVIGWRGHGAVEEIAPLQIEINYILAKIQRIMTLNTAQLWIEKSSQINRSALNNEDLAVNEFKGRPPIMMAAAAVSPEFFAQLDRLWRKAFEQTGITELNATGDKPGGIDSGVALRTYRDITSRRFLHTQQRWDEWNVDLDERFIDAARELVEHNGGYRIMTQDDSRWNAGIEELDFKAIDLGRDKFLMQPHPVSFLPDEPAGQMQTLKELGEVSPAIRDMLLEKIRYPDLEDAVAKATSQERLVDMIIDRALDKGEPTTPDAFIDPQKSIPAVRTAILMAELDGVPDDRIDILREFVVDTESLWQKLSQQQQPALPPGAAPGPAAPAPMGPIPGAMPGAPPVGPVPPANAA